VLLGLVLFPGGLPTPAPRPVLFPGGLPAPAPRPTGAHLPDCCKKGVQGEVVTGPVLPGALALAVTVELGKGNDDDPFEVGPILETVVCLKVKIKNGPPWPTPCLSFGVEALEVLSGAVVLLAKPSIFGEAEPVSLGMVSV
jgi:hypothetical protein